MATVTGIYKGQTVTIQGGFVDLNHPYLSGSNRPIYHEIYVDGQLMNVPAKDVQITAVNGAPFNHNKSEPNGRVKRNSGKGLAVKGRIAIRKPKPSNFGY